MLGSFHVLLITNLLGSLILQVSFKNICLSIFSPVPGFIASTKILALPSKLSLETHAHSEVSFPKQCFHPT